MSEQERPRVVQPAAGGYTVPETEERAAELLREITPGETMLEYETTGSSALAGNIDTVRRFEDRDELQVRSDHLPAPLWVDEEAAAEELVGRPIRIVEFEEVTA